MDIEIIKTKLESCKGSNLKAIWKKKLKTRKDSSAFVVEKTTKAIVRGGITYDNMKAVVEGREDGTLPSENAGLPWGEWAEFPFHITHKGTSYARLYPASGVNVSTGEAFFPEVEFTIDGKPATREQARALCLASEFPKPKDEPTLCFTLKAEHIVSLG